MDSNAFREFSHAAVEYIIQYMDNIRDRPVLSNVSPGFIQSLIPSNAPENAEDWTEIMRDMDRVIMPGMTHWQSPNFHAYFQTSTSYPSMVGELLSAALGGVGFSWMASPVYTELEVVVMDWLANLMNLPKEFMNSNSGTGGGVIQGSASETSFICLLAAKDKAIRKIKETNPEFSDTDILSKLVAYTSDQSNSSVEKAGKMAFIPMRLLPSTDAKLNPKTLQNAIEEDIKKGLIPFFVLATWGTTGTCAFDPVPELAKICRKYEQIWLHIDAAYAGAMLICPEYRHYMQGVELADSFNMNPHKALLVNFDCSAMWIKNSLDLVKAFTVNRDYLTHKNQGLTPDFRDWQIPLGRRFRALKLWIVLRTYGANNLREHIRNLVKMGDHLAKLMEGDSRVEIVTPVKCGLLCFRVKGVGDEATQFVLDSLTTHRLIYVVPCRFNDQLVIRVAIGGRITIEKDLEFCWDQIKQYLPSEETTNIQRATNTSKVTKKKDKILGL